MSDITSLLIILLAVTVCAYLIRILGRIVSWRITLPVLIVAVLVAAGLLDIAPILTELDHLITNLFGGTT
jgi:hypothetical protein